MSKKHNNIFAPLSRRHFLGMTAAVAATGALAACSSNNDEPDAPLYGKQLKGEWVTSYCGSCIYANCGTKLKIVDGVAVEIKGNPDHPANRGTLCPRGAAQLMAVYNPYRVKNPLKRTNPEKGLGIDPGWVEITWEEAIKTIGDKMADLHARGETRRYMRINGFSANHFEMPYYEAHWNIMMPGSGAMATHGPLCELHHAPGLYNIDFIDALDFNYCRYLLALGRAVGGSVMHASGSGIAIAEAVNRESNPLKIVSVDPHCGPDVSHNGEWVPILPGTDMALLMAMMHVMLYEEENEVADTDVLNTLPSGNKGMFDIESVKLRSNAAYLVITSDGEHKGDYARTTFINPTGAFATMGKPMMWDCTTGEAKAYDSAEFIAFTTPLNINNIYIGHDEMTVTIDGVNYKVKTAFQLLREKVASSTPEWAADITSIPAATIRRLTRELIENSTLKRDTLKGETILIDDDGVSPLQTTMPFRPVAVATGRGAGNNMQGQRVYSAAGVLNLLLGSLGVPGSLVHCEFMTFKFLSNNVQGQPHYDGMALFSADPSGEINPTELKKEYSANPVAHLASTSGGMASGGATASIGRKFYPLAYFGSIGATMDAIIDPAKYYIDYDIEMLLIYGSNPVVTPCDNRDAIAMLKKIPFVYGISLNLDESTYFCDIILPESPHYERTSIRLHAGKKPIFGQYTTNLSYLNYREPAITPVYNSRSFDDITLAFVDYLTDEKGLPKRPAFIGMLNGVMNGQFASAPNVPSISPLDPTKKYTYREILDCFLKTWTNDAEKGADWFKENGFSWKKRSRIRAYEYNLFFNPTYPANPIPGRRLPLYNGQDHAIGKAFLECIEAGAPIPYKNGTVTPTAVPGWEGNMDKVRAEYDAAALPTWVPNHLTEPSSEFDMTIANWKVSLRNLGIGGQDNNIWLREMMEMYGFDDWRIQIHPKAAAAKGLKDGDAVVITSQHGRSVEGVLKITSLIHPNVLGFPAQAGSHSKYLHPDVCKGTNYNQLLNGKPPYNLPEAAVIGVGARVKIAKKA